MKIVRTLHKIFAILVVPALGYMLGATIFNHFWDIPETEDLSEASHVITARACERLGPVTLRGFGYFYDCRATVENKVNGNLVTATARGFLTPDLIGKPVAGEGFSRGTLVAEHPYGGLGMVLVMVFGILWLFVLAHVANTLLKKYIKAPGEQTEPATAEPEEVREEHSGGVRVWGGRQRLLKGAWLWVVVAFCALVAVNFAGSAFNWHNETSMVIFLVFAGVPVLLLLNGLRRFVFAPEVAIGADGVAWKKRKLAWAQVRQVRLSAENVLSIEAYSGETAKIGRFGDEQATRIHVALGQFCPVPYRREDDAVGYPL